jgi:hypothetical protein
MASSDGGGPLCWMSQAHFTSVLDRISLHLHPFPSFPSIPRMDVEPLPSEGVGSLLFLFLLCTPLTKCVAPSSSSSSLPLLKCLSPYCTPRAPLSSTPPSHPCFWGPHTRSHTHTRAYSRPLPHAILSASPSSGKGNCDAGRFARNAGVHLRAIQRKTQKMAHSAPHMDRCHESDRTESLYRQTKSVKHLWNCPLSSCGFPLPASHSTALRNESPFNAGRLTHMSVGAMSHGGGSPPLPFSFHKQDAKALLSEGFGS